MAQPYNKRGESRRRNYGRPYLHSSDPRDWTAPGPYSGLGPRGYRRADARILEDVCERLKEHGRIDARKIRVDVKNGMVTLSGTVKDRRTKMRAEHTAASVYAVRDVDNRLSLTGLPGEKDEHRYGQPDRSTHRKRKGGALVFETNGNSHD